MIGIAQVGGPMFIDVIIFDVKNFICESWNLASMII